MALGMSCPHGAGFDWLLAVRDIHSYCVSSISWLVAGAFSMVSALSETVFVFRVSVGWFLKHLQTLAQ